MVRISPRPSRTQRPVPWHFRMLLRLRPKKMLGEFFSRTFLSLLCIGPMPLGSPSLRLRIIREGRATGNRVFRTANRVAGGFYPPAPTAPRMRVRTGRFHRSEKDHQIMATSNAGYGANRQGRFTRSGALRPLRLARFARCRWFRPSPCPTHYGGRLATMPSADFCPITPGVTARRTAPVAVGSGGDSSTFALALSPAPMTTKDPLGVNGDSSPFGPALSSTPIGSQAASGADFPSPHPCSEAKPSFGILPSRSKRCFSPPDKSMNFPCTTAAFTLSPAPDGLRHLVLTRPGARPSMRFLFVGSHFCSLASSRHLLAGLPLPSASSFIGATIGQYRYSYRGPAPHQFMPMPGVYK